MTAPEWLRKKLAAKPLVASEVKKDAKEAGIGERALRMAVKKMGIVQEQWGERDYTWRLPPEGKVIRIHHRNAGKDSAFRQENLDILLHAIEVGATKREACDAIKIHPHTLWEWLRLGLKDPTGPYGEFRENFRRAKAKGTIYALTKIKGDQDWRASAWWLSVMNPERFGDRSSHSLSVTVEQRAKRIAEMSDEQLRKAIEKELEQLGNGTQDKAPPRP